MSSAVTYGGVSGHILRRLIHLSIIITPFYYYAYLPQRYSLAQRHQFLYCWIAMVVIVELIRVRHRFIIFGQRRYEENRFSALGWTLVSLGVVFLFSPGMAYSLPIITACALADPLMGELRLRKFSPHKVSFIGMLVIFLIWLGAVFYFDLPFWLIGVMPPLTVLVERPTLHWIDDNALMLLVPLAVILIHHHH